jgi:murein DD-endopeptidase MepM/ murein hydrolase activator NlpD
MRKRVEYPAASTLVRLSFVCGLASLSAACSSGTGRFAENPFSNPFASASTGGAAKTLDPMSTASVGKKVSGVATTAQNYGGNAVTSKALPAPISPLPTKADIANRAMTTGSIGQTGTAVSAATPSLSGSSAKLAPTIGSATGWSATGGTPVVMAHGETIDTLSGRYGVPSAAILSANGLSSGSQVSPGTRVTIPVYNSTGATPRAAAPAAAPAQQVARLNSTVSDADATRPTPLVAAPKAEAPRLAVATPPVRPVGERVKTAMARPVDGEAATDPVRPITRPPATVGSNQSDVAKAKAEAAEAKADAAKSKAETAKLKRDAANKDKIEAVAKSQAERDARMKAAAEAKAKAAGVSDEDRAKMAKARAEKTEAATREAKLKAEKAEKAKQEAKVMADDKAAEKAKLASEKAKIASEKANSAKERTAVAKLKNEDAGTASVPKSEPKVEPKAEVSEASKAEFRWPARGRVINGFTGKGGNEGINIAVPEGTPVKAADGGTVAYAGSELKGYGNLVLIRHENGYVSAYAHNGDLNVKRGEKVARGQVIAKSGQSGNVSSPQLHFELRKGSSPVDPTGYLSN